MLLSHRTMKSPETDAGHASDCQLTILPWSPKIWRVKLHQFTNCKFWWNLINWWEFLYLVHSSYGKYILRSVKGFFFVCFHLNDYFLISAFLGHLLSVLFPCLNLSLQTQRHQEMAFSLSQVTDNRSKLNFTCKRRPAVADRPKATGTRKNGRTLTEERDGDGVALGLWRQARTLKWTSHGAATPY